MSRIIVIGDSIIDKYIYGTYTTENPENLNGKIIKCNKKENRLGGALSVSLIISGFDQPTHIYSTVGIDHRDFVRQQLSFNGIEHTLEKTSCTTEKIRVITDGEFCKNRLDIDVYNGCKFQTHVLDLYINTNDIIVIQDYGKGFCSDVLMSFLHSFNNKIIIDPYIDTNWKRYPRPFLIKCNRKEAKKATNGENSISESLKILSSKHKCHIIITDGKNGMFLYDKDKEDWDWIAPNLVNVKDVCGAGDTVLATIATGIARNIDLLSCCRLASLTASEQIQSVGINKVKNCFI